MGCTWMDVVSTCTSHKCKLVGTLVVFLVQLVLQVSKHLSQPNPEKAWGPFINYVTQKGGEGGYQPV